MEYMGIIYEETAAQSEEAPAFLQDPLVVELQARNDRIEELEDAFDSLAELASQIIDSKDDEIAELEEMVTDREEEYHLLSERVKEKDALISLLTRGLIDLHKGSLGGKSSEEQGIISVIEDEI